MKFQNARKGFAALFYAEILLIIGSLLGAFSDISIWLGVADVALMIVAFIMNLKGLKAASLDDEGYKRAYTWEIISIVVSLVLVVLGVCFKANPDVYAILNQTNKELGRAFEFIVACMVLETSVTALKKVDQDDLSDWVKKVYRLYQTAFVIGIVLEMIPSTVTGAAQSYTLIFAIVALVIVLISQIKYIVFLSKMKDNL